MDRYRIVLADKDANARKNIGIVLNKAGYNVAGMAQNGLNAEKIIRDERPDLVIIDAYLPGKDGFELAQIVVHERMAAVIITSPSYESELLEKARDAGAFSFLVKPVEEASLLPAVELAVANFQELLNLESTIAELKEKLETRKLIERAKGILMETMGLTEAEAYKRIQRQSMNKRIPMRLVARAIILSHDV